MNELLKVETSLIVDAQRLDQNPAAVYLAGLAPGSRRTMKQALDTIARIVLVDEAAAAFDLSWYELRFQHTQAIRVTLAERFAYSTANKMLSALRGVLKAAWKLDLMTAEDYHKAASVEGVKGETLPAGRHLAKGELEALLDTCWQEPADIRDAAIISLLYACGLRRAELVSLNVSDYDQANEVLLVRGKRNKQRSLPVVNGASKALNDWLQVRTAGDGSLFYGLGNRNDGRRLTTQAIYFMLQQRAERAGISSLSPHDFRRTFVGDLLDAGADISTVQKMAGHANVTTTARYDRRDDKAKLRAAELLHVPYTRRTLQTKGK